MKQRPHSSSGRPAGKSGQSATGSQRSAGKAGGNKPAKGPGKSNATSSRSSSGKAPHAAPGKSNSSKSPRHSSTGKPNNKFPKQDNAGKPTAPEKPGSKPPRSTDKYMGARNTSSPRGRSGGASTGRSGGAGASDSLNKYISSTGFCSRREADKLIEQARVTINGRLVLPGARVKEGDLVEIDGEPVKQSKKRPIYIAFNKPVGVTSTTDLLDKTNIISFINHPKRIFPVGRLDKDSDGLIFLTNDGDIVNKILRASNNHEKEYIVTVDKALSPDFITKMSNGIPIMGTVTRKCFVRQEGGRRFRIMLTQGLNRQIRRMCEYLDYKVVSLTRVRIMNVQLGNLPVGHWRYLTPPETEKLTQMLAHSSKTQTGQNE